jgi:broad specificity phosphatase PhoE
VTLILVRHGQSEGNARGVITGSLDLDLTDRGREEARLAGARLAAEPVVAVYSSALCRAANTGAAIATHHELEVQQLGALNEYSYGEAQGLSWPEIAERYQLTASDWGRGVVPGEEGHPAFRERIGSTIDLLLERHREDVAVVACHGGTIIQTLGHLLGLPPHTSPRTRIVNCSLTVIEHRQGRDEIAVVNDVCHLEELVEG